jgi:transposase InsO family protein
VYQWVERHRVEGEAGLNDRSRRPHHSPLRTPEWMEEALIEERRQYGFGSKKIVRRMQDRDPDARWPRHSTVDGILKRAGLVDRRKKPRRPFAPAARTEQSYATAQPGEVMTIDFKGQFRLRNRAYCYPLTVADPASRYLLACDAFERISLEETWSSLERVFRECGLPRIVHSDNGIPFGTSGHGRYSTISVRLMKYGVQPCYSRPGHPEDNGRHERMHKTLMSTTLVPANSIEEQQLVFDEFRRIFNEERPHEALGMDRPAQHHRRAPREFPERAPVIEYEPHFETVLVDCRGRIKWRGRRLFFSDAFINEPVAFERTGENLWRVHYGSFQIGTFDELTARLH